MKIDAKMAKILALALSLPSTSFAVVYFLMELVKSEYISKLWALIIFTVVIGNTLFLMVWYAYKKKN